METKDFGLIQVNVEHKSNGNAVIIWKDNGIGMDEFIVKNYLSIVGRSYYRSDEFKIQGLKMDPISRFGIGILSCFNVANKIEIETLKDRDLQPESSPLRVVIPDELRYFRIESPAKDIDVGTTIKIYVEGNKIQKNHNGEPLKPLDITGYLSVIAGFVDIPILVNENNHKTLILSPKQDPTAAIHLGKDLEVRQLKLNFPWEEAICPQDYYDSHSVLKEERVDVSSELALNGYEGTISYLIPVNDNIDILYGNEVAFRDQAQTTKKLMRFQDKWNRYEISTKGLSPSSYHSKLYSVYKNGILLSSASRPPHNLWRGFGPNYIPLPRIVINIAKAKTLKVDLSRTRFIEESEHWAEPIFAEYVKHIIKNSLDKLLDFDPIERAYQLGRISIFHNIDLESLWQAFPQDRWPFIFLDKDGCVIGDEWKNISDAPINFFPVSRHSLDFLFFSDMPRSWFDEFFSKWRGDKILIQHNWQGFPNSVAGTRAQYLWDIPIRQNHCFGSIVFLNPPWDSYPPFFQKILIPKRNNEVALSTEDLLEKAINDPLRLNPMEKEKVSELFKNRERLFADAVTFPAPFDRSFAFGNIMLNLSHPAGKAIFQFRAALELSKMRNTLPLDNIGRLMDALNSFDMIKKGIYFKWERFASDLNKIFYLANKYHLIEIDEGKRIIPSLEEFVPGTLKLDYKKEMHFHNSRFQDASKVIQEFGAPLSIEVQDHPRRDKEREPY